MAKVVRTTVNTSTGLKQLLDSLNCPLITTSVSGATFYCFFDATPGDELGFEIYFANLSGSWHYIHGQRLRTGTFSNNPLDEVTVCYSDSLFYLQIQRYTSASTPSTNSRGAWIYDIVDGGTLFGWRGEGTGSGDAAYYDLASFNLIDIAHSDNTCNFSPTINIQANLNKLFYTDSVAVSASGLKLYEDTKFNSCSTVVKNAVYTFNGKNYFALGTNILVPIDE